MLYGKSSFEVDVSSGNLKLHYLSVFMFSLIPRIFTSASDLRVFSWETIHMKNVKDPQMMLLFLEADTYIALGSKRI